MINFSQGRIFLRGFEFSKEIRNFCRIFFRSTKLIFSALPNQYKNLIFTKHSAPQANVWKKDRPKKAFLGTFYKILTKKNCVFSSRISLSKLINIGGPFVPPPFLEKILDQPLILAQIRSAFYWPLTSTFAKKLLINCFIITRHTKCQSCIFSFQRFQTSDFSVFNLVHNSNQLFTPADTLNQHQVDSLFYYPCNTIGFSQIGSALKEW